MTYLHIVFGEPGVDVLEYRCYGFQTEAEVQAFWDGIGAAEDFVCLHYNHIETADEAEAFVAKHEEGEE